jgi:four helix bundle protein
MDKGIAYKQLVFWKNALELRSYIYELTKRFASIECRRVSQMRDAARSVKQNIQEGYFKSTKSYIAYLVISRGSLNELLGDVEDCLADRLIADEEFKYLDKLIGTTDYLITRAIAGLYKKINKK